MKILYSAFECNPGIGSDAYVGWSWAKVMSQDNEVHVLTNEGNKKNIEAYINEHGDSYAAFHYVSLPSFLKKLLNGRKGYFASYVIWQWYAYKYAEKLNDKIHFDIIHHVSIADFRIAGLLWKLNAPYVLGPIGGGQETPCQLSYYIRNYKKKEKIRSWINSFACSLPIYKKAIRKAARVFVSNDETIQKMRQHVGYEVELTRLCELGIDSDYLKERSKLEHKKNAKVHILVSGRLMYRKGIELLLDAVKILETDIPFVVDLYGGGHQIEDVKCLIRERELQEKVILHGKVSYDKMPQIYAESDILALPSLRETTGTAVIEAMANKLPVVALEQNGVKYLIQNDCGILVDIKSREETMIGYADALKILIEDYDLRIKQGNNGYERLLKEYTWEVKVKAMLEVYRKILQ